jgi:hypothetical protein
MKHSFYDVKARRKSTPKLRKKSLTGKKEKKRYAFKAKTADGRSLTAFVSKDIYDKTKI